MICGLPYVWLAAAGPRRWSRWPPGADRPPLRRPPHLLLGCDRPPRQPGHPPGGAGGRSWAYNEPASHSGHTVTLYSLIRLGAGPATSARWSRPGSTSGPSAWSPPAPWTPAIDSQVLAIELRDHPRLAGLRVIGAFGPSTIQPVVAASRLPDRLKDQVRDLLVTLADDPAARPVLDYGLIDRFTPVGDAAYDDIRAMLATIETAGWTSLTQRAVNP